MARVTWSDSALDQVELILARIRAEDPMIANKWADKNIPDILADHPRLGSAVEEYSLDHGRELLVGSFRIIYTIKSEDEIVVAAVIRGQRDPRRVFDPENLP